MSLDRFSRSESSANENEVISYAKILSVFDKNKYNTRVVNSQTFRATMLRCREKVLVTTAGFATFLLKLNSEMSLENKAIRRRKAFKA